MRDTIVGRNYYALKLAQWICYGTYWQPTLTEPKALNLLERGVNHPAVTNRWGDRVLEIEVEFIKKSSWAGTWDLKKRRMGMRLPINALNELTVLHELAHCYPSLKREPHHGPGFAAIHLMLIDLVAPKYLPAMFHAYRAVGMPVDLSRIPPAKRGPGSTYVPLLESGLLDLTTLGALLASGGLTPSQHRKVMNLANQAGKRPVGRTGSLPDTISIPTSALLASMTPEDISRLVGQELKRQVTPDRIVRPKTPPKKKPGTTTRKTV